MSIGQFLIILWARRVLIIAATASCLIGALIVAAIVPPQWKATERIMLDYIKPDPVTGLVVAGPATHALISNQVELFTDYTVAGKVAEQVGWLTDPQLAAQYNARPKDDKRDFSHWTADIVIKNTKAKLLEDSNIIEVTYTGPTPENAAAVADALRKAYMDANLQFRHQDAERNALWAAQQAVKAKQTLDQAIAAETAYERANGLVMQDKTDVESTHLQALSIQGLPVGPSGPPSLEGSPASVELATVEAQLTSSLKTLGPNNPDVQALEARRASLKSLVERDKAVTRAAVARAETGGARMLEQQLEAQKTKVIAKSAQIGQLDQLHQDVARALDEYNRMQAKVAQYREESVSGDVGITPLGNATTPKEPSFPNFLLIVPGSIILGMGVGVFVSLLMELLRARVRTQEDLSVDDDVPLICVVPAPATTKPRPVKGRGWRLPTWTGNRGAVGA